MIRYCLFRYWMFAGLTAIALGACNPSDPTSPGGSGTLRGRVVLYDEWSTPLTAHGGTTVQLTGTSYTANTDADGNFSIAGLPTSTYDITISKPGYIAMNWPGFSFVGGAPVYLGGYPGIVRLYAKPEFTVSNLAIVMKDSLTSDSSRPYYYPHVEISGTVSNPAPDGRSRIITLWFSTDSPAASPSDVATTTFQVYVPSGESTFTEIYKQEQLFGLKSGTTYHAVAIAGTDWIVLDHDPVYDKWRYSGKSSVSNEVTFVAP